MVPKGERYFSVSFHYSGLDMPSLSGHYAAEGSAWQILRRSPWDIWDTFHYLPIILIILPRPAPNFQSYSGTGGGAASTPAPAASAAAPAEWGTSVAPVALVAGWTARQLPSAASYSHRAEKRKCKESLVVYIYIYIYIIHIPYIYTVCINTVTHCRFLYLYHRITSVNVRCLRMPNAQCNAMLEAGGSQGPHG